MTEKKIFKTTKEELQKHGKSNYDKRHYDGSNELIENTEG